MAETKRTEFTERDCYEIDLSRFLTLSFDRLTSKTRDFDSKNHQKFEIFRNLRFCFVYFPTVIEYEWIASVTEIQIFANLHDLKMLVQFYTKLSNFCEQITFINGLNEDFIMGYLFRNFCGKTIGCYSYTPVCRLEKIR